MVGISKILNVQGCGKLPFDDPITKIRCFSLQIGVVFHTSLLLMMSLSGGHSLVNPFYWVDLNSILVRNYSIWLCVSPWFRRVNHSTLYTNMKFGEYQQLYINCGFHGSPKTIFSWEKENRNPEILPLILLFDRASSPFRSQPLIQRCEQSLKETPVPPETSISKVS